MSGRGSAWLECLPWEQEVAGSNPVAPTIYINDLRRLDFLRFFPLSPEFNFGIVDRSFSGLR